MKSKNKTEAQWNNESGAALASVVLIGVLLMVAIIAVLSTVSSHSKNVTDVYSETQAYYAAESGIQATINVLRGNTEPLFPSPGIQGEDMDYEKAIRLMYSNHDDDPTGIPRLSRWLNYNYTPAEFNYADRVVLGGSPNSYSPSTGTAFKIDITDMDNSLAGMAFTTRLESSGTLSSNCNRTFNSTMTEQTSVCTSTWAATEVKVTVSEPPTNLQFGNDLNKTVPFLTIAVRRTQSFTASFESVPFAVVYSVQQPRPLTRVIRGRVRGVPSTTSVQITFDSYVYETAGSELRLCNDAECAAFTTSMMVAVPSLGSPAAVRNFFARMTPFQPFRIRLRSTGYGPNGAVKVLEAVLRRNFFDDLTPPAAVAMVGPSGPGFVFQPGNSNQLCYTGVSDSDPNAPCPTTVPPNTVAVPPIGVSNPTNLTAVQTALGSRVLAPAPAVIDAELPPWLQSPENLDASIRNLRTAAQAAGTYYPSGQQPSSIGTYNEATGSWNGITFCDGDCSLSTSVGPAGGVLVVTGKLILQGNFSFKGLIIVTGPDGVVRNGGGNGEIIGNLVIAPYNPSNLAAGFLPPKYDMRGGGNSDFIYSGNSVNFSGQTAISDFLLGIVEK
jgi:Flp pilus assembly pilin Flp